MTSEADDLPPASQKTKEQWLDYAQVIRLDDDEPLYSYLAYMNSSTILATVSRYEEALGASEGAIRFEPRHAKDAHNHVSKGWFLERLARHEEALAAYQEASRIEMAGITPFLRTGCKEFL